MSNTEYYCIIRHLTNPRWRICVCKCVLNISTQCQCIMKCRIAVITSQTRSQIAHTHTHTYWQCPSCCDYEQSQCVYVCMCFSKADDRQTKPILNICERRWKVVYFQGKRIASTMCYIYMVCHSFFLHSLHRYLRHWWNIQFWFSITEEPTDRTR